MYHRHIVAKQTFQRIDHQIWKLLWKRTFRRHSPWIKQRNFMHYKEQDWTFFANDEFGNPVTIFKASDVKIKRHPKIKGTANPYDEEDETYFEKRQELNTFNKLAGKHMLRYLYERQKGCC